MPEEFYREALPNGITLLGQRMEGVASAAMTFVARAGSAYDPAAMAGAATVASEWCLRGAGSRDTRALNDALDALGCQHHEGVQSEHIQFSCVQLGRNLAAVMRLYADILRRPTLADNTFDPCRDLIAQDLVGLEDEPARHCNILLRERFFPWPLGRNPYGQSEALQAMTAGALREHLRGHLSPGGAILAVAGEVDWNAFRDLAGGLLGDWKAPSGAPPKTTPGHTGTTHMTKDSAQTHIGLAHKAVPAGDDRYYAAHMAQMVLSGGMSSRLFSEVREKRGLAYHVSTRYYSLHDHAGFFTYAAAPPARAQETFDVTVGELVRLAEGITAEEMHRAVVQLKSALVMQGESTMARVNAMAADWYHTGRLRSLDEISRRIEQTRVEDVLAYLREFPAGDFTVLTLGPEALRTE
ncbi:MAG: pitrilysin family protein [Planctomycetota bacterium]|nr:pitrilysin family protein [Planctomycetota bacterium]